MPYTPRILAFAGSAREQSFNRKLIKLAAAGAQNAGAEVTVLELRDLKLPLYDQDDEAAHGLPDGAKKLKEIMLAHDGLLISAPEYNSSITPLLKNAIDWASRPVPNEAPLGCFVGKIAGLMSASPGVLGGLRGLVHVRSILENIQVIVIPNQVAVSKAGEAFNEDGTLKDAKQQASVEAVGASVTKLVAKIKG